MKVKIRRGCFETNSSSMHSIVVTKEDRKYSPEEFNQGVYINKDGEWHPWGLDFGRSPFAILNTFESKLRYAIAEYCGGYSSDDDIDKYGPEFDRITKKYFPSFDCFRFDTETRAAYADTNGNELPDNEVYFYMGTDGEYYHYYVKDGKNIRATRLPYDIEYNDYGSIDHQSAGMLSGFLKSHNITLEEFLTNKRYIIIIDGDEYCELDNLFASGLVNLDNISETYPYKLKEDYEDKNTKACI